MFSFRANILNRFETAKSLLSWAMARCGVVARRHCERSEAIQRVVLDGFVASLLAMPGAAGGEWKKEYARFHAILVARNNMRCFFFATKIATNNRYIFFHALK